MLVVVYFCEKDWRLAVKNLSWCIELEKSVPYECLLACDTDTPEQALKDVESFAQRYFSKVHHFIHSPPPTKGWPAGPNYAWQQVAWHIGNEFNTHWFWWESDVVPLRANWLKDLDEDYKKSGLPFAGYIVKGVIPTGHMNGVAVYPQKVTKYCPEAFLARNTAWDVVMGKYLITKKIVHHIGHLYQHCWALKDCTECVNDSSFPAPHFDSWDQVSKTVNFNCAIFHRCKDGSLIDVIRRNNTAVIPEENVAAHTDKASGEISVSDDKIEIKLIGGETLSFTKTKKPNIQILIVTHAKDIPWLKYCIRSIEKYGNGFDGITVSVPWHQKKEFNAINLDEKFKLHTFNELEGHGMMQHEEQICSADRICSKAEFILHVDSDCIFKEPFYWWDYVIDGRAVNVCRTYDSLWDSSHRPEDKSVPYHQLTPHQRKVVSDCYQWKECVKSAIGFYPTMYTMCRHPSCYPSWLYKEVRKAIELNTGKKFHDYIMEQKNSFPQSFAEFPTLGGFAWEKFKDRLFWFDISETGPDGAPRDKLKAYWSHGGLGQEMASKKTAEEEIEEFLR